MYTVHPSIQYLQNILDQLEKTTAHPLSYWIDQIKRNKIDDEQSIKNFLIDQHKLGSTKASIIASYYLDPEKSSADYYLKVAPLYVDAMFQKKPDIKPIFDHVINFILAERPKCKISPCETIVPIYHNHVIAQCKPSTKTRLDFGLALKNYKGKLPKKIIDTGGLLKNDRITHCFPLYVENDFDKMVLEFFDIAFELDNKTK